MLINKSTEFIFPWKETDIELKKSKYILRKIKNVRKAAIPKGQLISECLLGTTDFPENQRKFWQVSALESKK